MSNKLFEVMEMLIKLDGLKEEEIKIIVEEYHNVISIPRIKMETYHVLKEIYNYGITEEFNNLGQTIRYNIFIRTD